MEKNLCLNCSKIAVWCYVPSGIYFYCDVHVPRGCTCNNNYVNTDGKSYGMEGELDLPPTDSKDWKWLEEGKSWCYVDEQGRELPCCEYEFYESGWEKEKEKV